MGREAFLAEVKRTLPGTLEESDGAAVLLPRSTHEVVVTMRLARRLDGQVTPPGGEPRPGAVPMDLRRLGDILACDEESRILHVQSGVSVGAVEAALLARGLTLGLTTRASELDVGAWLALGAPGARHRDDDPVDQHVAGLSMVLLDGRELTIRPAPRRAVGPDLTGAMVGGRGALGVILSAHLVARPHLPGRDLAFLFPDAAAAEAARAWIRGRGVRPARTQIARVPEGHVLLARIEGDGIVAAAAVAVTERTAKERGGVPFSPEEVPLPAAAAGEPSPPPPQPSSRIVSQLAATLAETP
jgi:FAD/FMN-containing dehydrogenase